MANEAQHNSAAAESTLDASQTASPLDMNILNFSLTRLWNEALLAQGRRKKLHQDTINKILKSLASVFGNGATGTTLSASVESLSNAQEKRASLGALVPRKRPRLMIENGSADDGNDFAHFEPHATNSLQTTPVVAGPTMSPASPMNSVVRRSSSQNNTPTSAQASISPITPANPPPPTPASVFPPTDEHAQEQMYQEAIAKLLSSPNPLQLILAIVSSQMSEPPLALAKTYSKLAPHYSGPRD
ncbi:hypothetical protein FRC09_020731 [Ceratobasidium sp. 395]|nr:hypothetical protein FRC09_020731 [Ceratobasidium sp. 395]